MSKKNEIISLLMGAFSLIIFLIILAISLIGQRKRLLSILLGIVLFFLFLFYMDANDTKKSYKVECIKNENLSESLNFERQKFELACSFIPDEKKEEFYDKLYKLKGLDD